MSVRRLVALRDCATLLSKARRSTIQDGWRLSQTCGVAFLQQDTSRDAQSVWQRWAALCGATIGVSCLLQQYDGPARCFAETDLDVDEVSYALSRSELLRQWLTTVGAEIDAVDIRQSHASATAGLGVFASEGVRGALHVSWWKWPWYRVRKPNDGIVLATFPLQAAITPKTIISDPVLGGMYQELLDQGDVDDSLMIILFLMVEKHLGRESSWQPWIDMLPDTVDTPLFYSDDELKDLSGTTLEGATRSLRNQLSQQWKQLEPVCKNLLSKAGAASVQPSLEDFEWAHAIYWSRSQSFPEPISDGGQVTTLPSQGVVPGIDFCNHRENSTARWTIFGNPNLQVTAGGGASSGMPTQVALVCPRQQAPKPGQEITISYGDKSNEQLLMAYGFTQTDNLNDFLMIGCPIAGPEGQDEILQARLEVLRARGLTPQLFLPAKKLDVRPTHSKHDRSLFLPDDVLQTLEVFVMERKQLLAELTAAAEQETAVNTLTPVEKSGERMAVLTTLVGLLMKTHDELEGDEGTGSLEDDMKILEEAEWDDHDSISDRQLACVIYRSSQKRIAREYLIRAQQELAKEMQRLKQLTGTA